MSDAEKKIAAIVEREGISLDSVFIPFSASRNAVAPPRSSHDNMAKEPWKSLNWTVTIKRHGKAILSTEYAMGVAHCPAYKDKRWQPSKALIARAINIQIETGKELATWSRDEPAAGVKPLPGPPIVGVMASLCLDSGVLDYACFDDWAADYGYDTDSRDAERIYRECLETALKLRAGLGQGLLDVLREASAEY